jgi:hypothetical protein
MLDECPIDRNWYIVQICQHAQLTIADTSALIGIHVYVKESTKCVDIRRKTDDRMNLQLSIRTGISQYPGDYVYQMG